MKVVLEFLARAMALAGSVALGIGVSESSEDYGVALIVAGGAVVVITLPYLLAKAQA